MARDRDDDFGPVEAGEWIRPPVDTPLLMECCDCGLVHALTFDHDETGRIIFAAERDEDSTARQRAKRGLALPACVNCGHAAHGEDCHGATYDSVTGDDVGECDCEGYVAANG